MFKIHEPRQQVCKLTMVKWSNGAHVPKECQLETIVSNDMYIYVFAFSIFQYAIPYFLNETNENEIHTLHTLRSYRWTRIHKFSLTRPCDNRAGQISRGIGRPSDDYNTPEDIEISSNYLNTNILWEPLDRWLTQSVSHRSGGRLNIKMPSYQYRDPHVKYKTVSRPCYL